MIRICPICNMDIKYKNRISFWKAKKINKPCIKCTRKEVANRPDEKIKNSERQKGKRTGSDNPFFNKKHSDETKDKIRKNSNPLVGKNNPMYGKNFYTIWVEKFGKEIADEKMISYKKKKSQSVSGHLNPMYGKPSPNGSGNGWSGWYKNWYFRSITELSYFVNVIERFNIKWATGETIKIPYVDYKGVMRNYYPDFILNDKYIIECKPEKLINSKSVKIKSDAAIKYCNERGLVYKIVSPYKLSINKLKEMYINGDIKFIEKYEEKVISFFNI